MSTFNLIKGAASELHTSRWTDILPPGFVGMNQEKTKTQVWQDISILY